jgi:hypothetical protein
LHDLPEFFWVPNLPKYPLVNWRSLMMSVEKAVDCSETEEINGTSAYSQTIKNQFRKDNHFLWLNIFLLPGVLHPAWARALSRPRLPNFYRREACA